MLSIDSLLSALRGSARPDECPLFPPAEDSSDPNVARVEQHVRELLAELQASQGQISLSDSARDIFRLLGEIPKLVHWDEGFGEANREIILGAIHQAERFGDNTGPLKRRFAVDLIVRVLRHYNQHGFPFLPPIEDAFVKPLLGVYVDWIVKVLNIHKAWPAIKHVTMPSIFQGEYGGLVKLGIQLLRLWIWVRHLFFYETKYERQLRDALRAIEPQTRQLLVVLPPEQAQDLASELVSIFSQLGQLTAPYLKFINDLLQLSGEMADLTADEREQAILEIVRDLLLKAYAGEPLIEAFLESSFGELLIREMIRTVQWVLVRNGLMPTYAAGNS